MKTFVCIPANPGTATSSCMLYSKESCPQDPTNSSLLEGRWRLLFTTRPGSASPIQRAFTGVEAFTVYQEVLLSLPEQARVNNIVDFGGKIGSLKAGDPTMNGCHHA